MSGSSPSDPKWWVQELRGLLSSLGVGLRDLANEFKRLYQVFQSYVYVLVAEALREHGVKLNVENLENGVFVFNLGTRSRTYKGSSFSFIYRGNSYALLFNVNVNIGMAPREVLNLDVAIAKRSSTDSGRRFIVDEENRANIAFFVECKSINHGSMEYLASCLGQRFLVKRSISRSMQHMFTSIVDVLAVRGAISGTVTGFYDRVRRRGWKHVVKPIGWIAPHGRGIGELKNHVKNNVLSGLR